MSAAGLAAQAFILSVSGSVTTKSEILHLPPSIIPQLHLFFGGVYAWGGGPWVPCVLHDAVLRALAGATSNAVPVVLLVIFSQKYFIRTVEGSAGKG